MSGPRFIGSLLVAAVDAGVVALFGAPAWACYAVGLIVFTVWWSKEIEA